MYAQSTQELWIEIQERFRQSNVPLIYQLERDLSQISQGNLTIATYFGKLKRYWDELNGLNPIPTRTCGKLKECACKITKKLIELDNRSKLMQFRMKLNGNFDNVRSQVLALDPLPTWNKAYYIVQQIEKQKQVTTHEIESSVFFANDKFFK